MIMKKSLYNQIHRLECKFQSIEKRIERLESRLKNQELLYWSSNPAEITRETISRDIKSLEIEQGDIIVALDKLRFVQDCLEIEAGFPDFREINLESLQGFIRAKMKPIHYCPVFTGDPKFGVWKDSNRTYYLGFYAEVRDGSWKTPAIASGCKITKRLYNLFKEVFGFYSVEIKSSSQPLQKGLWRKMRLLPERAVIIITHVVMMKLFGF